MFALVQSGYHHNLIAFRHKGFSLIHKYIRMGVTQYFSFIAEVRFCVEQTRVPGETQRPTVIQTFRIILYRIHIEMDGNWSKCRCCADLAYYVVDRFPYNFILSSDLGVFINMTWLFCRGDFFFFTFLHDPHLVVHDFMNVIKYISEKL